MKIQVSAVFKDGDVPMGVPPPSNGTDEIGSMEIRVLTGLMLIILSYYMNFYMRNLLFVWRGGEFNVEMKELP